MFSGRMEEAVELYLLDRSCKESLPKKRRGARRRHRVHEDIRRTNFNEGCDWCIKKRNGIDQSIERHLAHANATPVPSVEFNNQNAVNTGDTFYRYCSR